MSFGKKLELQQNYIVVVIWVENKAVHDAQGIVTSCYYTFLFFPFLSFLIVATDRLQEKIIKKMF